MMMNWLDGKQVDHGLEGWNFVLTAKNARLDIGDKGPDLSSCTKPDILIALCPSRCYISNVISIDTANHFSEFCTMRSFWILLIVRLYRD